MGAKKRSKGATVSPFHERFDIVVDVSDARERFLARVKNYIFENFFNAEIDHETKTRVIMWQIANELGEEYHRYSDFDSYVRRDFHRCLQVLEIAYNALRDPARKMELNGLINMVMAKNEIDLGVTWQKPFFVKSGAELLDEHLVNEPLRWLSNPKYRTAYVPFEKGLSHFLASEKKPQLLADVVTDMYESIEALSKVVTGRTTKDLSANAEMFVKSLKASEYYKQLLKDYISYANQFRHAAKHAGAKPQLSTAEVESFVYLTGLFIRLASKTIP